MPELIGLRFGRTSLDGEKWARARMMAHLYLDGARSFDKETNAVVSAVASAMTISTDEGRVSLQLSLPDNFRSHTVAVPTTADLGRVRFPDLEFDAHDGSPIQLGTDLLGSVADGPTVPVRSSRLPVAATASSPGIEPFSPLT